MLQLTDHVLANGIAALRLAQGDENGVLRLPFERRQKSRFRHALVDGREVAVTIPRGRILRDGDGLVDSASDVWVRIEADAEKVSTVYCADARLLARACYHLGNRHVALQIGDGFIRYLHDHVLDDMLTQFDLTVQVEQAPFEPEAGAYGHYHGGGHGHAHG